MTAMNDTVMQYINDYIDTLPKGTTITSADVLAYIKSTRPRLAPTKRTISLTLKMNDKIEWAELHGGNIYTVKHEQNRS